MSSFWGNGGLLKEIAARMGGGKRHSMSNGFLKLLQKSLLAIKNANLST